MHLQSDYILKKNSKTNKVKVGIFLPNSIMITKKNSLLFKIKLDNGKENFQVNNFKELFLEDGLFASYLNEVFGIATHNFNLKIYKVTFKETTPKSLIEDLFDTFKEPQYITTKDNIDFSIQANRPLGCRQLVTLYPMPFDINLEQLKTITKTWGIMKHFEFGKHKKCPLIHNPYLHIYLENFNRNEVPDQIIFRNRFVAINIDGEQPKPRCNYCKKTDHLIEDCPLKTQTKVNQIPINAPQPKLSYAQTVTSNPKTTQPPFSTL